MCVSSKKRNIGIIEPSLVRNITLLGVLKILLQKMYIQYTYFVYISSILIRLHFLFHFSDTHTCPIFRLGDIIDLANGSFTKISVKGGVVGVYINWNCDLDWDFEQYCLPKYKFRILDTFGWNFRHAYYHEENRRTLVKAYGLKFMVVVDGRGSKFDLKNTVIVLVTGLGLLGLSTMFCDFILLNYSTDRKRVSIFSFIFCEN